MKSKVYLTVVTIMSVLLFISSCVKDTYNLDTLSKEAEVNPNVALKIARGSFNLGDAINPTDTLVFHPDKSISVVLLEDSIIALDVNDIVEIPAVLPESGPKVVDFTVGQLLLSDFTESKNITLQEISNSFTEPTRSNIQSLFGTTSVFPAISPAQAGGSHPMNPFTDYTFINIASGTLGVTVTNQLPVVVSLTLRLFDSNNTTIGNLTFNDIAANGGTAFQSVDLAGMALTNQYNTEITQISSPGSAGSVPVEATQYIGCTFTASNVMVSSGTAVIPDQRFDFDSNTVDLELTTEQLYKIKFKTAQINYTVTSSIEEDVDLVISLPASTVDGQPATFVRTVSFNGGNPENGTISLNNSLHDLTTDMDQAYNIIPFKYELVIRSSNNQVTFASTDGLQMELTVSNIQFEYAEGYIGSRIESIDVASMNIEDEILDKITGTFELADPKVKFKYKNSFGVPAELDINVDARFKDNSIISLAAPPSRIDFPADTIERFVDDSLVFDKTNTQIEQILVLPPPVEITYSGTATLNPDNDPGLINFVTNRSRMDVDLEFEVPLEFKASNLALQDTVEVDIDPGDFDPENLKFSKIYLNVQHWFPLGLQFQITPYDTVNMVAVGDPLVFDVLEAAEVNDQGIVEQVKKSNEEIDLTGVFFQNLVDANSMIIKVTLNTTGDGTRHVKILTTYSVDFQIGILAEFNIPVELEEEDN